MIFKYFRTFVQSQNIYLFQSIMICSDIDLLKYEDHRPQEKTLKGEHELAIAEVSSMLMLHRNLSCCNKINFCHKYSAHSEKTMNVW